MNTAEAAALLSLAAIYDNRAVAEPTAQAWQAALADLPFEYAKDAVVEHYATSTVYLMPAHIREIVKHRRDREWEQRRQIEMREQQRAIGSGVLAPNLDWLERKRQERKNGVRALAGPSHFLEAMDDMAEMLAAHEQQTGSSETPGSA